jgi:hypothetical protein
VVSFSVIFDSGVEGWNRIVGTDQGSNQIQVKGVPVSANIIDNLVYK